MAKGGGKPKAIKQPTLSSVKKKRVALRKQMVVGFSDTGEPVISMKSRINPLLMGIMSKLGK